MRSPRVPQSILHILQHNFVCLQEVGDEHLKRIFGKETYDNGKHLSLYL